MDAGSLDHLSRTSTASSRRFVMGGAFSGILASLLDLVDAAARKRKKKRGKKKKRCRPESPATTCAGRCGAVQNNCRQSIECLPCPTGQFCLSNGNCATDCVDDGCPLQCSCPGFQYSTTEGAHFCIAYEVTACPETRQVCESTSECPLGTVCQLFGCGQGSTLEGQCRTLCEA